jgi:hypothetical protein
VVRQAGVARDVTRAVLVDVLRRYTIQTDGVCEACGQRSVVYRLSGSAPKSAA